MKKPILLFSSLFAAFLFLSPKAQSQCDSTLQVGSPDAITIMGDPSTEEPFMVPLQLKSKVNASYSLSVSHLVDSDARVVIQENEVSVSPGTVQLVAGQTKEVKLLFSNLKTGKLSGHLSLQSSSGNCEPISIPLHTELFTLGELVLAGDPIITISTAKPSFLNFLIPRSQDQRELLVQLENNGDIAYELEDYSLTLRGKTNGNAWTKDNPISGEVIQVLPDREKVISIPWASMRKISPDVYNGTLRLFFKGVKEPLKVQVQANLRGSVIGALLVLLIGILIGRMVRTLDDSKDQIELMDKLYSLENGIKSIDDEVGRESLLGEWNLLKEKIGKMEGAEQGPELVEAVKMLKANMAGIQELEILSAQTAKIGDSLAPEQLKLAYDKLVEARDFLLDGKTQEAGEAIAVWKEQIKVRGRGLTENGGPDSIDSRNMETIIRSIGGSEVKKVEKATGVWARIVQFLKNTLQLLAGVAVSSQLKYWFFRPLVLTLVFLIILFAGFKEIYLDGSSSFGSEGMTDYLKLMLWGLGSDLFSRELIGTRLMGMKEKIGGTPTV